MKVIIKGLEFRPCTAIANGVDGKRQAALYCHDLNDELRDGDAVIFGYDVPDSESDVESIIEDCAAWDSDCETLKTAVFAGGKTIEELKAAGTL